MKKCASCGTEKASLEFRAVSHGKVYSHSYCRDCRNKSSREYRARNRARCNENTKRWRRENRERYLSKHGSDVKRWEEKNAHKRAAYRAVSAAVKVGALARHCCCVCGCSDSEAHHSDYSKPLDVIWLCPPHHAAWHRNFEAT